MSDDKKQAILDFLSGVEGKGVEKTMVIAKAVGLTRREASKLLGELQAEGKVQQAGAAAGVVGFKLVR